MKRENLPLANQIHDDIVKIEATLEDLNTRKIKLNIAIVRLIVTGSNENNLYYNNITDSRGEDLLASIQEESQKIYIDKLTAFKSQLEAELDKL